MRRVHYIGMDAHCASSSPQRFIMFAIRDQSCIRGDSRAVEFQFDMTVEIDPQRMLACFTLNKRARFNGLFVT